jgi:exosome complex exonuclease RRP6
MSEAKKAKFSVDVFAKQVFGLSLAATKLSNTISDDREECDDELKRLRTRLLDLMRRTGSKRKGATSAFSASDSNDAVFEQVMDAVDHWLESVDRTVDRLNGVTTSVSALAVRKEVLNKTTVIRAANVMRPQLRFVPPVDNSSSVAFVPHLSSKPNAIVPLAEMFLPVNLQPGRELESAISSAMRGHLTARLGSGGAAVPNPYEAELQALEFLPEQLKAGPEQIYRKLQDTPCEWIDTVPALEILIGKLMQEKEIAIDLEQHFFRSYQGFVCLMQLSTRTQNFLIDTLELRSSMQKLNVITTNPRIVKVLHGADFDVQWLQRDFGLFVVNMFDTGQAARVLEYQKKSLAFLLDKFCSVQANKQYQLADWRMRPLPKEMERYAVEDTHYLLYIYDRLRSELAAKSQPGNNLILNVLNRSRELCLQM